MMGYVIIRHRKINISWNTMFIMNAKFILIDILINILKDNLKKNVEKLNIGFSE